MQRCVNVIGVGMSPFSSTGLHPDIATVIGLTARKALDDAGVSASQLTTLMAASDMPPDATLPRALKRVAIEPPTLLHLAPTDDLLAAACQAIELGQAECVMVLGVQGAPASLPMLGVTLERLGAAAHEYMARYQMRRETLAMIAVKARQHGAPNPLAVYNQLLSLDQVLGASLLADPLTLPQLACPAAGVAAVVLCSCEFARRHSQGRAISVLAQACVSAQQVAGVEQTTAFANVGYEVNVAAARELYEQAGRGPQEVAVCELHDSSTLNELLLYEALGFCPEGSAERLVEEGDNTYGGNLVVNPSGGLLSLGQAGAASALAQTIELVQQLRGSTGRRQVANAAIALQHQASTEDMVIATLFQRQ